MTFWRFRRITDAARLGGSVYVLALAITVAILVYAPSPAQALLNNGEPASDILGQFTSVSSDTTADYVKGCPNNGASQIGFDTNAGSAIDPVNHWLFVPEQYNNRVVVFQLNSSNQISSKTPSYVLGQTTFTTCAQNQGNAAPSASSLNMGQGSVCVDSSNQRLYVPDWGNNRVLVFSTSSMSNGENASYELGQPSGGTAFTTYAHATTQSGLYGPEACTYDSTNQLLYVADYDNNRVMVFSTASLANGENASYVLGQSGYGIATAATTQAGMSGPNGVTLDSSDHQLYVSDSTNNRILEFNTTSLASGMNASTVFGQSSYGSGSANEGGSTSQIGLSAPGSLAYDSVNYRLFASDTNNNRALVFNTANVTNDENATDILGQFTSPSSDVTPDYVKSCVNNGASQIGFNAPDGGTIDPTNHWLFIADQSNNRVLVFPLNSSTNLLSSKTASYVLGQTNFVNCSPNQGNGTGNTNGTQSGLYLSNIGYTALAVDPVNQLLYVPDYGNNRVMVFSTASMSNGENASYVIGQSNFTNSNYSTSQSRLTSPTAAALDNTNHLLYVADSGNNRVMIFPAYGNGSWAGSSENALYEIGQPSGGTAFTSSTAATTQSGLSYPVGVAVDVGNSLLYVADEHNNRVVIFPVPVASNGENASYELGQASGGTAFTSKTSGTGQSGMNGDYAVTLDTTNSRLFVGDYGSNRILIFPAYGNASWAGNGENASFELGETTWTSGQGSQGQNSFDNFTSPGGTIYDSTNSLLYVADAPDNRVLEFNVAVTGPTLSSPTMDGNDACAIAGATTGALYCWGENNEGEDGIGNTTGYETPQLVGSATNWTAVSQGDPDYDTAACGIAGGALYCWGHNNYGELGLGNTTQYTSPQQVGTDTTWTAISVGGYDSCGIDNGKLYCWGFNTNGEDGQGNTTQYTTPQQITYIPGPQTNLVGWWKLTDGSGTTAADSSSTGDTGTANNAPTWINGPQGGGLTLNGTNQFVAAPDVAALRLSGSWTVSEWVNPAALPASGNISILLDKDDTGGCTNYALSLDNGNISAGMGWAISFNSTGACSTNYYAKYATTPSTGTWYLVTGVYDSVAQTLTLYINGSSVASQSVTGHVPDAGGGINLELGAENTTHSFNGSIDDARVYNVALNSTQVAALYTAVTWSSVSTNNSSTCGITGGALYCWGNNNAGQLGIGNNTASKTPQQVGTATNWIAINQGYSDTCGIRGSSGSGALFCWGSNANGELGLGGATSNTVFVTSTTYNGDFGSTSALAATAANADCAARATAAGLSGTYLAWIASIKNGSAGANDPFTTFVQSVFPYKEVNGTVVATNWTKLVSGTLTNAITLSESGGTVSGDVWSNVATTGKASTNGNSTTKNCAEWSNGAADTGNFGVIGSATASWTFLTADTATCSTSNSLYCFQQNANPAQQNSPVQVGTDTTWSAISIQNDNSTNADACGIDNGKLYCWGQNANGEDGLGNTTQYTTPQQVGALTTWTAVSYGANNTCGIAGNQLYCWGQNHFGQDGIGNATQQTTPAAVSGVGDIGNDEDATDLLGEYNSPSSTATLVWTQYGQNNGPTALGFIDPAGIALDTVHHQLFVSDSSNNRVLVYTLTSSNTFPSGSGGHTASYVLGQTGLQGYNSGGSGLQAQLCNTNGLAVDTVNSRLFVADNCNNRVIVFSTPVTSNGPNAIGVLGNTVYNWVTGTHTQSTFNGPYDVAYDSVNQNLYVADYGNNRVLVFSVPPGFTNGENASYEFGQPSGGSEFTTHASADTQSGMNGPSTLAYDSVNSRLFVNDQGNNRVLVFSTSSLSDGPNATNVVGQTSFTTAATADTQTGLHEPSGIAYDATDGWLFVADCGNGRVLEYNAAAGALPTNNASADFVLGAANFVSGSTGNAPTQSSLDLCQGAGGQDTPMTYDPSNARLFVSDEYNNRVMIFNAQTPGEPVNDEAASYVLGQTNFTNSNGSNIGYSNVSQSGLSTPNGVAFDPTNDLLYVDDSYNSRLMQFNVAPGTLANGENASDLLGEYSSPTSTATVEWTQNGPNNGPTALGMSIFNDISQPAGYVTLDPVNHYLYVADNNNNRVMIYALNTDNSIPTASGGHTATYVLGQTSLQGGSNANCTASTMDAPMGLAYDSVNNRLFVVQQNQARVLVFDNMSTPSNGMAASYVLGEPNLTTCGYGNTASQSQFGTPWGVAYDAVNQRLFVVDNGWTAGGQGNRVLVFNVAPGTIANGENASYVLGQSNFTNTGTGTTATTMYGPIDAAYDPVNTRLFVSDENNNRVLVFNVPTSVTNGTSYGEAASYVLGASNFTTTGSYGCNNSSTGAPQGLAYDANNSRLFVAQTDCNNVMVFNVAPGGIQNGENASYELGHTNFTSNSSGTSQTQFSSGGYVYYDPGSGRLFVGDSTNNRILIFEGSFGDPNFFLLMPD